ncbi:hypothetical protein BBP40_005426 [Aspergillus hancockii]|nr:hypothetical protein BBP40_005426 [Aspergillus hancockii]
MKQLILSTFSGSKFIISTIIEVVNENFYKVANAQRLTYLSGTPSMLHQIDLAQLQHLRMVTAAGEVLHRTQYEKMRAQFAGPINNVYGVTQTTVYTVVTPFEKGSPFKNELRDILSGTYGYVLNDRLERLPMNAGGELHLSGDCLTHRYLNQYTLPNEWVVPNPFLRDNSGRGGCGQLYKILSSPVTPRIMTSVEEAVHSLNPLIAVGKVLYIDVSDTTPG